MLHLKEEKALKSIKIKDGIPSIFKSSFFAKFPNQFKLKSHFGRSSFCLHLKDRGWGSPVWILSLKGASSSFVDLWIGGLKCTSTIPTLLGDVEGEKKKSVALFLQIPTPNGDDILVHRSLHATQLMFKWGPFKWWSYYVEILTNFHPICHSKSFYKHLNFFW